MTAMLVPEQMYWVFIVVIGGLAGFLSGFGLNAGGFLVPAFLLVLPLFGIGGMDNPQITVATAAALMIPLSLARTQAHALRQAVDWETLVLFAPGLCAGAFAASIYAPVIAPALIILLYVVFALIIAARLWYADSGGQSGALAEPNFIVLQFKGLLAGIVAAFIGISIVVPPPKRGLSTHRVTGTTAALGLPLAVMSVMGYLLADKPAGCEQNCIGYIYLPAVGVGSMAALLAAPVGAALAPILSMRLMRRGFALFLVVMAVQLSIRTTPVVSIAATAEYVTGATGGFLRFGVRSGVAQPLR